MNIIYKVSYPVLGTLMSSLMYFHSNFELKFITSRYIKASSLIISLLFLLYLFLLYNCFCYIIY